MTDSRLPLPIGADPGRAVAPPPLRRPLVVALVGVLAVAVAGVVGGDLLRGPAVVEMPALPFTAPTTPAPLEARDGVRLAPALGPATTLSTPRSGATTVAAARDATICGLAQATEGAPAGGAADASTAAVPAAQRAAMQARWRDALRLSRDERARVVAALAVVRAGDDGAAAATAIDALAQQALRTRDGWVYGVALQACAAQVEAPAACRLLHAEQWARLDAANALPWLHAAADARTRGDAAGEAEAMYRASLAATSDAHWGRVPAVVARALPADLPPLARSLALVDAWSLQAALAPAPQLGAAAAYCAADALADGNRRQVCESLARLLAERGRTAADANLGRALGERLGWPAAPLHAAGERQRALLDAAAGWVTAEGLSCSGVERLARWARMTEADGEVGAARELASVRGNGAAALRTAQVDDAAAVNGVR